MTIHSAQAQKRQANSANISAGDGRRAPRGALPDRNVTPATLEDAYVSFIFHCNPALPRECDTDALREAFRNPPKSAGKKFDTFAVYELVKRFYAKEVKTWTELTIKLGVEPPDPSKDESSQKLTQYGVRLKKWLNSLHVKSFFEYLMGIENEYWTKIPADPDPIGHAIRDGIAVEDDMALRALLPHIRPKRGRKRPDEVETPLSAQRRRLSPSSAIGDRRQETLASWPVLGEQKHLSAHLDIPRSAHPGFGTGDGPQTPFSRYPSSAITPTNRTAFWEDVPEPQSAITPSAQQPKGGRQRRGAKNVSSAWNFGGSEGGGKARGRPRINRTPVEGPSVASQSWSSATQSPPVQGNNPTSAGDGSSVQPTEAPEPMVVPQPPHPPPAGGQTPSAPAPGSGQRGRSTSEAERPARPSISLQVPRRAGGPVRLATPPPRVAINGQQQEPLQDNEPPGQQPGEEWHGVAKETTDKFEESTGPAGDGLSVGARNIPEYYFEKIEDRTSVDEVMGLFMRTTQEARWFDSEGRPAEPASMDEAAAIVNATLQTMFTTATSTQAFLINLGALAGSQMLMTSRPTYYRMADGEGCHNYRFEWEYRFGHLRGHFHFAQSVPWCMWKSPSAGEGAVDGGAGEDGALSAEDWKQKYKSLLGEMKKKEQELSALRAKVMTSMGKDLT